MRSREGVASLGALGQKRSFYMVLKEKVGGNRNMVLQKKRRSVKENENRIIKKQLTAIHQGERMR